MKMHVQIRQRKGVYLKLVLIKQYKVSGWSILFVFRLPMEEKNMCTKLAAGKSNK